MESYPREQEMTWTPALLRAFAKEAGAAGGAGEPLAYHLERIRTCESVLAPAAYLFSFVQGFDGKTIDLVAARVREQWGTSVRFVSISEVQELHAEFRDIREDIADRWIGFAETLVQGDYASAIGLLIQQNEATMQMRGGAAWVVDRQGRLNVRVRDEQGTIPPRQELATLWRFPYFLDSLLAITSELGSK
jgi:hypothetical protein